MRGKEAREANDIAKQLEDSPRSAGLPVTLTADGELVDPVTSTQRQHLRESLPLRELSVSLRFLYDVMEPVLLIEGVFITAALFWLGQDIHNSDYERNLNRTAVFLSLIVNASKFYVFTNEHPVVKDILLLYEAIVLIYSLQNRIRNPFYNTSANRATKSKKKK